LSATRRVQPDWQPNGTDLTHISQVCRLVEGVPLAILLAAAWIEVLSPSEIATELGQGLGLLRIEYGDLPERQRSMRAVFDQSWNLLSARGRELMQAVAVFRGSFARLAAERVAGASLGELMTLVSRSGLRRTPEGRYEVHDLIRQYVQEHLDRSPDGGELVRDRHCAFYVDALRRWASELKGAWQETTLKEMDAEAENARAAWQWALERGQLGRLSRAMEGLCLYCDLRVRFEEGVSLCRITVKVLAGSDAAERLRANVMAWQARLNRKLGQVDRARELVEESLSLLAKAGQPVGPASAELAFALEEQAAQAALADREEGMRLYRDSLSIYRELSDLWHVAQILNAMGEMAHHLGRYGESESLLKESLSLHRTLGYRKGVADALTWLGYNMLRQGRTQEGVTVVQESCTIRQEIGDQAGAATGYFYLARAFTMTGAFSEVRALADQAGAAFRDLGMRPELIFCTFLMGWSTVLLGQYERGRALLRPNLALARQAGVRREVAFHLFALGQAALAEKAYAEAQGLLQESVAAFQALGQGDDTGMAVAALAYAERGLGQPIRARDLLCQALQIGLEIRAVNTLMVAIPAIALLLVDRGHVARAVELYALVRRHPSPAGSVWHEDVAGKHIAAAAAQHLPPQDVEAAQGRGRARDLWETGKRLLEELVNTVNGKQA
jgi:predicted ATPase